MEETDRAASFVSLTRAQWEEIETVSAKQREVGNLMAREGKYIFSSEQSQPKRKWDDRKFIDITNVVANLPIPETKAKNRKAEIIRAQEKKNIDAICHKIKSGSDAGLGVEALVIMRLRQAKNGHIMAFIEALNIARAANAPLVRIEALVAEMESVPGRLSLLQDTGRVATKGELAIYPDQRELCELCADAVRRDAVALIRYCTPPSGGKTTVAAALAAGLESTSKKLIYVCYNHIVCTGVARSLTSAGLPYAVWSRGSGNASFLCFSRGWRGKKAASSPAPTATTSERLSCVNACDRTPLAHVCDLESAQLLLETDLSREAVIFVDEPTAGRNSVAEAYGRILSSPAKITILASATIPTLKSLSDAIGPRAEAKFGKCMEQYEVVSRRPAPCASLICGGGKFAPHDAGLFEDLSLHALRFYTASAIIDLVSRAGEQAFDRAKPTVTEMLVDSERQLFAGRLLSCLTQSERTRVVESSKLASAEEDTRRHATEISQSSRSGEYPGVTLLLAKSTDDSVSDAIHLEASEINLPRLTREYEKLLAAHDAERDRILSAEHAVGAEETAAQIRILGDAPTIRWPRAFSIHTTEHLRAVGADHRNFPKQALRSTPEIPLAVLWGSESGALRRTLSNIAIAIASPPADAHFGAFVGTLTESGKFPLLVGNASTVYGSNFPVDRIVVENGGVSTTAPTMIQLSGRVGRRGSTAERAEVIVPNEAFARAMLMADAEADAPEYTRLLQAILGSTK